MQVNLQRAEVVPHVFPAETPNRPAAVVESFVRRVEAGQVESAIRLLSEKIITGVGFQKLESIFSASALEIGQVGGIESVEVWTLAFSIDHVEMQLTIWYGDHRVESEVVELVRERGKWKISMEEVNMA